jgi:hypothetical protein
LCVLLRRKVKFMVVGLSAATLQGAPVVTQDVDLWFEKLGDPSISNFDEEIAANYQWQPRQRRDQETPQRRLQPPLAADHQGK